MNIIKAKKIAFSGVMVALSVVVLYMASILPTLKLASCAVASAIVCAVMLKYGVRDALAVYIATSVIAVILSPDRTVPLGYLLFFGNYPVVKAFIERIRNLTLEWIVKVVLFILYSLCACLGLAVFFPGAVDVTGMEWLIAAVLVGGAVVYDIALSLIISEFVRRFPGFIK